MSNSLVVVIIGLAVLPVVVELIVAFGAWSKTQGNLCVAFSVNKEVPQHWSRLFMTKKEQSQCELTIRRQQRLYKRGMKSECLGSIHKSFMRFLMCSRNARSRAECTP